MKTHKIWVVYDSKGVSQGYFLKCEEQLARDMAGMIQGSCQLVTIFTEV